MIQDFKRGTAVDLYDRMIGDFFMLCQLPFPVFFYNLPDLVYPFDHKHMGIPKIVFRAISVLHKKGIVFCVKGIDGVQKACKMIVEASPPDERVSICVCFQLCPVNVKLFQGDKAFLTHPFGVSALWSAR